MSTHYRPRPLTAPPTPQRPSTAQSTIRTVPPSPPDSVKDFPRTQFEPGFDPSKLSGPYRDHVLVPNREGAQEDDHPTLTDAPTYGAQLKRGGVNSGRTSPTKSRSRSPQKKLERTPSAMAARQQLRVNQPAQEATPSREDHRAQYPETPDTPSPLTREQKQRLYEPLGASLDLPTPPPSSHADIPKPLNIANKTHSTTPRSPSSPPPHPRTKPLAHAKSTAHSPPMTRMPSSSTNNTGPNSINSRHSRNSIFSTPGRDELERKKALVEADEGPFGRVKSLEELEGERRRVSGGSSKAWQKEGSKKKEVGCGGGVGCCVM